MPRLKEVPRANATENVRKYYDALFGDRAPVAALPARERRRHYPETGLTTNTVKGEHAASTRGR